MAVRARRSALSAAIALAGLLAASGLIGAAFTASPQQARRPLVARTAYESGKVNLGVDAKSVSGVAVPPPVLEVNEAANLAIMDCLEEGCSVEAMMALDSKLARDEAKLAESISEAHAQQKTAYSEDGAEQLAWLDKTLKQMGTLRAQLHHLKSTEDTDFIQQMVKAASVAFGGGRETDYPKVGVSSYSS